MAHQPKRSLLSLLGLVYWGDLGELTIYKDKQGKIVAFRKTWPSGPATPAQQIQRDRFRSAAIAWQALELEQRSQWELATRRTSLCMHGYDLFLHHQLIGDDEAIRAIERQSNTTLLPV